MSWIQKLSETYDNCQSVAGHIANDGGVPLLPICHTTQRAHIEIVIDKNGKFKTARVVPKDEGRTIIPCTERSGGRTSGEAPHPLCDKLQYIAKDYKKYGGEKKHYFDSYQKELSAWCNSPFRHPKAVAVLEYVRKGRVVQDLVEAGILYAKKGRLMKKWEGPKEKRPLLFSLFQNQEWQAEAFIRWEVTVSNDPVSKVWRDEGLWENWISYYSSTKSNKVLCYVTGNMEALSADQHPRKIRNDGDGAKLIASGKSRDKAGNEKVDDGCGFTFLGRFENADQACGVSLEASQKAHLALQWLIRRQGYRREDQAIVAWSTGGKAVPQPTADSFSLFDDLPGYESPTPDTAQGLAFKLKKRIAGYGKELGNTSQVVVIGLDSATPGRMSITFYRELTGSEFLERVDYWHSTCQWIHNYRSIEMEDERGKKKKKHIPFVGAPAPSDIAEAAYGNRVDDKLRKTTVGRILPCIVDGQQLPWDLVESAVRRASNRIAMDDWEWNKTLSIACALFKKYNTKEEYSMALDPNRKTRDYLYGRLLAIADRLEGHALYKAKEKRDTNAARYMQLFADRPNKTWRQIYLALSPYMARLGGAAYYKDLMDEVMCKFDPIEDFNSDKPLSGEFLLGYHCQRAALWKKEVDESSEQEETN